MRLDLARAVADAAAQWRRDRDVLTRVAAVFFFLPSLAFRLFVPEPAPLPEGIEVTPEMAVEQMLGWLGANAHWLLGERLIESFGCAVLLAMLLDPRRLQLGDAMREAARRFGLFVVASVAALALVGLGWMAFVLPGLYLVGRTFLVGAVVMAEPDRPAAALLPRAIAITRGHGWVLLLVATALFATSYFGAVFVGEALFALQGGGPVLAAVQMLLDMLGAALSAAVVLATVLVQASLYRALAAAEPRHGT